MTRNELIDLVENTFEIYGIKTVSKTDVEKGAYIPNKIQKEVLTSIGISPREGQHITIKELFTNNEFEISYYPSVRESSGRTPEIRMGLKDLISYINRHDEVLFTTDGTDIFIYNLRKLDDLNPDNNINEENVYSQIDIDILEQRASIVNPRPTQITTTITTYPRNNTLRAFIKEKANYNCQMPDCSYEGFLKSNGKKYIEVHHLTPLSEGGEDTISNTVALCPTCHMKLHHAENKEALKQLILESLS